ncbi:flavin monoamine oxidase family protein [Paraburkholderia tuberum]|uniref:Tryptophan 2-monooxygenase n=1 Tax=Paraburkholderia tuberum TaxID=157910 RepID=A0A1H1GA65_9BURK|nr:NAD(P)/FAD-dependent oxidoreductase [Paraburkholderia tuberum]SDR09995.1 monoamine oxidase [Paraburkholderia tuberum]
MRLAHRSAGGAALPRGRPDIHADAQARGEAAARSTARVAIVGAGLAGLAAGWRLARAGIVATIYEASSRVGGRVQSARGLVSPEIVSELGAEFIDSTHAELLSLVREFRLPLIDTAIPDESALTPIYHFGGRRYSNADVIEALEPFARRMSDDARQLSDMISHSHHSPVDAAFDAVSIEQYLDRIGMTGWVRQLLDVAYATEYGLDTGEQSCLNLLKMLSLDLSNGFQIFGSSDQRYKIAGGNELLPRALATRLGDAVRFEHTLLALRPTLDGYRLEFGTAGGIRSVKANFVVLCVPFTVLRAIELPAALPPWKRRAIDHLGYGANEKVIVGVKTPLWRAQECNGDAYSDCAFQTGWDSGRLQRAPGGAYTFYLGGAEAVRLGARDPAAVAHAYVGAADGLFAGMAQAYSGVSAHTGWTANPFSRGAYSCYRPEQWTTLAGAEFEPVGNLQFAGEHCSAAFQGFMNGAVETGWRAADAILQRIR